VEYGMGAVVAVVCRDRELDLVQGSVGKDSYGLLI
jgi:hypothetical protein